MRNLRNWQLELGEVRIKGIKLNHKFRDDIPALLIYVDVMQQGAFEEEPTKGHGRIDCRRIQTMTPLPGTVNFPHIAQIFRIERDRESCKSRKKSTEIAYGITSVPKDRGTPEKLLAWNRGHWSIENNNHRVRDVNFKEDACLSRTMHAPNNGAICNCIALAIILSRGPKIAETRRYFNLHRHEAVKAVLSPR